MYRSLDPPSKLSIVTSLFQVKWPGDIIVLSDLVKMFFSMFWIIIIITHHPLNRKQIGQKGFPDLNKRMTT